MTPRRKHVVLAGGTGLVGREVVRLLHDRPEVSLVALVRREGVLTRLSDRVQEVCFDFEDPAAYGRIGVDYPCEVLLCTLGTTIKVAGSEAAFRRVDLDYPAALLKQSATLNPRPVFGLVSSAGAGNPRGFYLSVKAELERKVLDSGIPYVILRPSLLLGEREVPRTAERLATLLLARPYLAFAKTFAPRSKGIWKYAPIEAAQVAAALVRTCVDEPPHMSGRVLGGLPLHHPILDLV